jgi:ABC-type cobalt transport system substrate-binding protein
MKKSELAMVVLIAAGSMLIAYFVANAIFGGAKNDSAKVPTIQTISSQFDEPDPTVFNSNAINPTVGVSLTGQ